MQLTFDSDVEEFRAEFSAFLDEHLPSEADTLERPRSVSHMPQWARDWQRLLFDNGWLLPAQPLASRAGPLPPEPTPRRAAASDRGADHPAASRCPAGRLNPCGTSPSWFSRSCS